MNRAVLLTVWWPSANGPFGAMCHGCSTWMYPVPIIRKFSGAGCPSHLFNYRFCSETCVDDWKIKRLEKEWKAA